VINVAGRNQLSGSERATNTCMVARRLAQMPKRHFTMQGTLMKMLRFSYTNKRG